MAELKKILSYPANDIDKILQQGVYSVADDNERLALPNTIKTTNRTVYVRSTGLYYAWNGETWQQLSTPIDTEMSDASENAVQNKVIKEYVDGEVGEKQDKNLFFTNVVVENWVADNTYPDYPYKASVQLNGVDSTMFPFVVLNMNDAASGNYGPTPETYIGGIYLWSKVEETITIPVIIITKTIDLDMSYIPNGSGGYTLTINDANTSTEPNDAGGLTLTVEE